MSLRTSSHNDRESRRLKPGDLLFHGYMSTGRDIALITHTFSMDIAQSLVIFIPFTDRNEADAPERYELRNRGFLRDRTAYPSDEITTP